MSEYLKKSQKYKGYHYSVLNADSLHYLHDKTLEMLRLIIPIFEANNICYMICGGTLLGAFTTGKFVPWDDDIDLCVLDSDYDRMIYCLMKDIPDWITIQWNNTEKNYYHGWVKIRDKHSHVYPDVSCYEYNGVWIDVYKLSYIEKNKIPYIIAKEHLDYLKRRCMVGDISVNERDKRIIDNNLSKIVYDYNENIFSSNEIDFAYIILSASKVVVEKEYCFERKKYSFEGMQLYSFNNAEQYLISHYGDNFMMLPPDEMRRIGINKITI